MVMLSTSVLSIKWTIQGKPKSFLASVGGDLIIRVHSQFTLNQISGQVIEHEEFWDLSASSFIAQAFFWTSRRLFATIEAGKDLADGAKDMSTRFSSKQENPEVYPDPSGDPTKVSSCTKCYLWLSARIFIYSHIYLLNILNHTFSVISSFKKTMDFKEMYTKLHCFWQSSILLYNS